MPTYEYQCQDCGDRIEIFQKFSDKPLKTHEACGGDLQKVFHASGVVFKGSGYYVTDSRSSSSSPASTAKASDGSTAADNGKGSKETDTKKSEVKSTKSETASAAAD